MKIGFIMPSEAQRKTLDQCRESVLEMRPDQIRHLEHLLRSWRIFCIRGLYGKIAKGQFPDGAMLAYHSLTLGAAIRFVDEGQLDGSEYFVGKPVEVLDQAIGGYTKARTP